MTSFRSSTAMSLAPRSEAPAAHSVEVRTVQSREADSEDLRAAEELVRQSFGSEFRDNDWHHGLGGTHVFINDAANTLLGHAAIVSRVIRHDLIALHVGYVEAVAVRPDLQGRGLGRVIMNQVESVVQANYQLGALNAIEGAVQFYLHRGWTPWTGATASMDRAGGIVATDNGVDRIMLFGSGVPVHEIDQGSVLTCDWRTGDLW